MTPGADVRVVGVGGAGGNALRHMIASGIEGATLVAANTDTQALLEHPADAHVVLGRRSTRGLGAGGRPSVGFAAAQESTHELRAAPLVAHLAREAGALVVGVVTLPFGFEGRRRHGMALQGLDALAEQVDSLLVIPNDRLLGLDEDPSILEVFHRADMVLGDGVRGIGDLVMRPGLINLDFADVSAVLTGGGRAVMGTGAGFGPDRAVRAVEAAATSPLLSVDTIDGAGGVLMCFTIDPGLGLSKIHAAAARVQAVVDDDAEILFGVAVDPSLDNEVRVTLVAAGLEGGAAEPRSAAREEPAVERAPAATPLRDRPYEPAVVRRRNALVMLR